MEAEPLRVLMLRAPRAPLPLAVGAETFGPFFSVLMNALPPSGAQKPAMVPPPRLSCACSEAGRAGVR